MARQNGTEDSQDKPDDSEHGLHGSQLVAAELSKAFQEIAKGEQTASALERQLDGIESKINEMLAAAEQQERTRQGPQSTNTPEERK